MITIQGYDSTLYILARLKLSAKIAIKCAWDEPSRTVSQGQRRSFCIGKNVARHHTPGVDPQVTRGTSAAVLAGIVAVDVSLGQLGVSF